MTDHIHLTNLMKEISPIRKITKMVEIIWESLGLCTAPARRQRKVGGEVGGTDGWDHGRSKEERGRKGPYFFLLRAWSSSPRRRQPLQPTQTSCSSTRGPRKIYSNDLGLPTGPGTSLVPMWIRPCLWVKIFFQVKKLHSFAIILVKKGYFSGFISNFG